MARKRPSDTASADGGPPPHKPTGIRLTSKDRRELYSNRRVLTGGLEETVGLRIPFDVYFKDPLVAKNNPKLAFDDNNAVPWEPGLADGPTSARFAVVDYDSHTESLSAPARWDEKNDRFLDASGAEVNRTAVETMQFHQVHVWAVAQRALDFFESGFGLGRSIPWAFDGSRLIIVPHAGVGENAYYDRKSKSLQFYYFDDDQQRIYTCLSTDIINHEFGHAILDGIRPYFMESIQPETGAFHEFMGDMTAILMALRNNGMRQQVAADTGGDLTKESVLSSIAAEFGTHVANQPFLRSARSEKTMAEVAGDPRPHFMSQVMTGAIFDILIEFTNRYIARGHSVAQALAYSLKMQSVAVQPLDLLPPIDATFRDYALAVVRAEEVANPNDPDNYRDMMIDVFVKRGILTDADRTALKEPHHLFQRLDLDIFHDVDTLSGSVADAYRFLDDNRRKLFIPRNVDVTVVGLAAARKLGRQASRLPKQILLQYLWREDVVLEGPQFGQYDGESTSMLCGGTLALNENGEVLAWPRKPGTQLTSTLDRAKEEQALGIARRAAFLETVARQIKNGRIGVALGGSKGLLAKSLTPLTVERVNGELRFELSPHFGLADDIDEIQGGRSWQISS